VESATRKKGDWNRWHFHVGPIRIELDLHNKQWVKYRIIPESLLCTAEMAFINVKPNIFLNDFVAVNVGNVFLHKPPQYTADLISHEITRSYQYFIFMKAGTERPVSKLFSITNVNSKILIFSISTLTVYLRGMPI